MRYLGGKSRIGKRIADAVAPRGVWWEPFCGGLNVTRHLATRGPGLVSDAHPALIALYEAVRAGWEPPAVVSRDVYEQAKQLPDNNPLKAFCGFALSFNSKWFAGYTGAAHVQTYRKRGESEKTMRVNPVESAARVLARDMCTLQSCVLFCSDFLEVGPVSGRIETIYCDPPYEGVTSYSTGPFPHAVFWARCQEWTHAGVRVFVSEYTCPVRHEVALAIDGYRDQVRSASLRPRSAPRSPPGMGVWVWASAPAGQRSGEPSRVRVPTQQQRRDTHERRGEESADRMRFAMEAMHVGGQA